MKWAHAAWISLVFVSIAGLAWFPEGRRAVARPAGEGQQQKGDDAVQDKSKGGSEQTREQKGGEVGQPGQKGGQDETQQMTGALIRPMVPQGGSGPEAVEEGEFTLPPGDMIELECAFPSSNESPNLTVKVDHPDVIKLIPGGLRELRTAAMVGGRPRPITGMRRAVAIFQAHQKGEALISLNLGQKQYQYRITVGREDQKEGHEQKKKGHDREQQKKEGG